MTPFRRIAEGLDLGAVDRQLAELVWRLATREDPAVSDPAVLALTAAVLSRQRGQGHSCLSLSTWAGKPLPGDGDSATRFPDLTSWRKSLESSDLVGNGQQPSPMVLDGDRLYLYRYHRAEQRLTASLQQRLAAPPPKSDLEALRSEFRRFFPPPEDPSIDWQAVAATLALTRSITLVSGGPGTGKTTTVSRILALALIAEPGLRIALAAPTGKAAARLGESIAEQINKFPELPEALIERLTIRASTLHRLLGFQPSRDHFHHGPERPLSCDLLVVDEASMVDLLLMDAVIAALPPRCRLLLLGDRHQLASVETGFVFGDLCTVAGGFSESWRNAYQQLAGRSMPARPGAEPESDSGRITDLAVELQVNFRFQHQKGIGRLATAVRDQDQDRFFAALGDPGSPDVRLLAPPAEPQQALSPIAEALREYLGARDPADALRRLEGFRLLSPIRRGPWGVESLNRQVESFLANELPKRPGETPAEKSSGKERVIGQTRFGLPGDNRWYPGRPVLVTANDYQVRLFNGDLGVCWPDGDRLYVFFPGLRPGEELRRFPLAKLPPHDTAWAITVHKSQGSELDHVLLVLGDRDVPVLSRELLYTGITRARKQVTLVASDEVLKAAISRRSRRESGLGANLAPAPPPPTPAPAPSTTPEPEDEAPSEPQGGEQLSLF